MKRHTITALGMALAAWFASAGTALAQSAPLITHHQPGTPRSDFFGFVGFKFTVGDQPITVTELGRFVLEGNSQSHVVKLTRASDGTDLPGGSVVVDMAGGVTATYVYSPLATPLVLAPNTSYYLASQEAGSKDDWTDHNTVVQSAGIASVDGAVYMGSGFQWTVSRQGNFAFGPVNLRYSLGPTAYITSPANESSVPAGSAVTVAAAASHFSGTITRVEFFDGPTSLGVQTSPPYSLTISNVTAGVHQLTVIATDDQDRSATSPAVSLEVVDCDVSAGFVTSVTPGTLRNNFTGPVGMQITMGAEPVLVTDLGRMFVAGNNRWHELKIVRVSDETAIASVPVNMVGGVVGHFTYGRLAAPVILEANTAYYLVSMEQAGNDAWYEHNSTVTVSSIARVDGAAFRTYEWGLISGANRTFVPVSLKYAPCGVPNDPVPAPNQPPTVALVAPADQTILTAPALILIEATAEDSDGVIAKVEFFAGETKLGEDTTAPYQWVLSDVLAGEYTLSARATDNQDDSVTSTTVLVRVVTPEPEPEPEPEYPPGMGMITMNVQGVGRLSPNLNGRVLPLGRRYSVTATPAAGMVFSNWTGSIETASPRLIFIMEPGLDLQANFIPNPFLPVVGSYNGLFFPPEGISRTDSGFFSCRITVRGACTGFLILEGRRVAFRGQFNLSGQTTIQVARKGMTPLVLELQLDLNGGDQITGTVSDGQWTATVAADRATFNTRINPATEFAGKYTVILDNQGEEEPAVSMGYGHGTTTVTPAGMAQLNATLPDGTRMVQRAYLSKTGQWPVHAPLYNGVGLFTAWLALNSPQVNELSGLANWVHPEQPRARMYREAFTNDVMVTGARFQSPISRTNSVIDLVEGVVVLSDGDLIEPIINDFTLTSPNRITNLSTNRLTLSISTANGTFRGSVQVPGQRQMISIEGALLQNQNAGWGFARGTNHAAKVFIGVNE